MLKEIGIIFGAIGCIFLSIPLYRLFPRHFLIVSILTLFLLTIVLVCAAYDVKKLVGSNQRRKAGAFTITLLIVIIVALTIASLIASYPFNYGPIIRLF